MGGVRSRLHCLNKWSNIRDRLEREREGVQLTTGEADVRLLRAILDSGVEEESELVWSRLPHKNAWSRWSKLKKGAKVAGSFPELVQAVYNDEVAKLSVAAPTGMAAAPQPAIHTVNL